MIKNLLRLFTIIALLQITITAQNQVDWKKLDKKILESLEEFDTPGLAVGVYKDGKTVYAKGFGYRNNSTKDTVTTNTLFGIASLSKAFTAASIGMLVDEKKLNWTDRVIDYLPNFKLSDPYVTSELRIEDLLCHRAGFNTFDGDLLWYTTNYSREEIVNRFGNMPAKNSFRIRYGYSNIMYIVAGEVIKAVSGKPWEEFVSERILKPLNMRNTTTTNSVFNDNTDVAYPHLKQKVMDFMSYDNVAAAAGLNSNVSDLLKWLKMWLNKGLIGEKQIISEDTWSYILKSHTALNGGSGDKIGGRHFSNAALGWFLSDLAGRKVIAHGGGLPGFITRVTIVPEDNLAITVLTNDESALVYPVTSTILNEYFGITGEDEFVKTAERLKERKSEKAKIVAERRASRKVATSPTHTLESYVGEYEDKIYGKVIVGLENENLTLKMAATNNILTGSLSHWHYNTFTWNHNDPFLIEGLITFKTNHKGEISGLKIDLPNPDFHFYNFHFIKK